MEPELADLSSKSISVPISCFLVFSFNLNVALSFLASSLDHVNVAPGAKPSNTRTHQSGLSQPASFHPSRFLTSSRYLSQTSGMGYSNRMVWSNMKP